MLHFILNGETDLQKQFNLNPAFWSGKSTESQIQQLMEYFLNDCLIKFQEYRYHYLSEMLNQVRSEDDTVEKRVYILVKSAHRICSDACFNKKIDTCKRQCDSCGSKVISFNGNADTGQKKQTSCKGQKYIDVGNKLGKNNKKLLIGVPILLNLNSYENIENILLELKLNLKIGTERNGRYKNATVHLFALLPG